MINFKKKTKKTKQQKLIEREISQSLQDGIKKEAMRKVGKKLIRNDMYVNARYYVNEIKLALNNTCYHEMPTLDDKFLKIG